MAALSLVHVATEIDGLILVAAGTAHWRAWAGQGALRAWLLVQAIRLAATVLPFYPGRRLGFGGNQPRALMRDWIRNATSGHYALHRSPIDYEAALQSVESALLAINLEGDAVAPLAAPTRSSTSCRAPASIAPAWPACAGIRRGSGISRGPNSPTLWSA